MNQRNYQRELDNLVKQNEASGIVPKLLLHVCCAPCSSFCLESLAPHFDVTVFFCNPNIDDPEEYHRRAEEEKRLLREMNLPRPVGFLEGEYSPERFHEAVRGHETDPEGGERCGICFELRLRESAKAAKAGGFDYFTTSLTISPMKSAPRLNAIGERIGAEEGVAFLPSDFKKKNGFLRSTELSREYGLYRQDYCGCSYSKREAAARKAQCSSAAKTDSAIVSASESNCKRCSS